MTTKLVALAALTYAFAMASPRIRDPARTLTVNAMNGPNACVASMLVA
ncbi:MAG: hypothetical protein GKS06_12295 [Acidobacteria bacterium]|nr:hypothetical protein [Acidobacteriota bacterium]